MAAPPPVKLRSTFQSPIEAEVEADNAAKTKKLLEKARRMPPPDRIDITLRRQVEAFALLLQSRYAKKHLLRMCPDMPVPKEAVDGMDLAWTMNIDLLDMDYDAATKDILEKRQKQLQELEGTDEGKVLEMIQPDLPNEEGWMQCGEHIFLGKKSLETLPKHRSDHNLLDSPRSSFILLQEGLNAEQLRKTSDDLADRRRMKMIGSLQEQYLKFSSEISMKAFVRELRSYNPKERREELAKNYSSKRQSPVRSNPKAQTKKINASSSSTASPTATAGTKKAASTEPPRAKPRNLDRLQRHREMLTAEWGVRQQSIAHHSYTNQRVQKQVQEEKEAKRERAILVSSPSPLKSNTSDAASVTSYPTSHQSVGSHHVMSLPSANAQERKEDPPRAATSLEQPGAFEHEASPLSHGNTQPHSRSASAGLSSRRGIKPRPLSTLSKVDIVRQQYKEREEQRVQQLLENLKSKEEAAMQAQKQKEMQHRDRLKKQQDRANEVREVNERMQRTNDFRRLLLIRDMEDSALANDARSVKQREEQTELKKQHKQRATLEHQTKEFVERGAHAINKKMFQQEMAAETDMGAQRVLKEESRSQLVRLLKQEDDLINQWKTLETRCGNLSSPLSDSSLSRKKNRKRIAM